MSEEESLDWVDTKFEDMAEALEELQEENASIRQKVENLEAVCEGLIGKVKWLEDWVEGFNAWCREDCDENEQGE